MSSGKICHLVGAGDFDPARFQPEEGDLIIACDGGRRHLEKIGVCPDLTVGDFDSYEGPTPEGEETVVLPREKDVTDMECAARIGLERGYRRFILHGALGGARLSHTLGNFSLLLYLKERGADAISCYRGITVGVIGDGERRVFEKTKGYVSFFASGGGCRLTLHGFLYDFDGEIDRDRALTVSNEVKENAASAKAEGGAVFFVTEEL